MKKKKSITKLKKELEDLAKLIAKTRDNYICQKCGVKCEGSNAHGSHVIPVSQGNQFRFDTQNIKCLCYHCHLNWWHKNPIEACEWFKQKFPDRYEYLFGQARQSVIYKRHDYEEMILEYKEKVKQCNLQ